MSGNTSMKPVRDLADGGHLLVGHFLAPGWIQVEEGLAARVQFDQVHPPFELDSRRLTATVGSVTDPGPTGDRHLGRPEWLIHMATSHAQPLPCHEESGACDMPVGNRVPQSDVDVRWR